ncbi:hypothetical protein Prudu_015372 [Prunus dulcis]|uniref:Uncharacterized protein n=1 Tax=Prunus dulcis TaxID=3755 RepID=A0A4Y1RIX9_PRUDU|nr:hypothetical protein Prudu_015372 [Prunus dulcis]
MKHRECLMKQFLIALLTAFPRAKNNELKIEDIHTGILHWESVRRVATFKKERVDCNVSDRFKYKRMENSVLEAGSDWKDVIAQTVVVISCA